LTTSEGETELGVPGEAEEAGVVGVTGVSGVGTALNTSSF